LHDAFPVTGAAAEFLVFGSHKFGVPQFGTLCGKLSFIPSPVFIEVAQSRHTVIENCFVMSSVVLLSSFAEYDQPQTVRLPRLILCQRLHRPFSRSHVFQLPHNKSLEDNSALAFWLSDVAGFDFVFFLLMVFGLSPGRVPQLFR
jgi:hypothetical protein